MAMLVITRWYIFKFEGKKQKFGFHGPSAKKTVSELWGHGNWCSGCNRSVLRLFFFGTTVVGDRFVLLNLTDVGVLLHDLWMIYGCTQNQPLWSWLLGMYSCMPGLDLSDLIFFLGKMIAIDPFLAQVNWPFSCTSFMAAWIYLTTNPCPWLAVSNTELIGGLEHVDYFSIYWEFNHPNWRTHHER